MSPHLSLPYLLQTKLSGTSCPASPQPSPPGTLVQLEVEPGLRKQHLEKLQQSLEQLLEPCSEAVSAKTKRHPSSHVTVVRKQSTGKGAQWGAKVSIETILI